MTTREFTRRATQRACFIAAATVAVAGLTVGFTQADHVALDTSGSIEAPAPAPDAAADIAEWLALNGLSQ